MDTQTGAGITPDTASWYMLIPPQNSTYTYLVDRSGDVVHTWKSAYTAGLAATLSEDGSLYREGSVGNFNKYLKGAGGVFEKYDWDGNLLWQYVYANEDAATGITFAHHDFTVLPNGDVLFIAADVITAQEAISLGRDPADLPNGDLVVDKLVEVKPEGKTGGQVVWEWRAIDHVVQDQDPTKANFGSVAGNPGRIDFNYLGNAYDSDGWTHFNSVDYDPTTDQVLVSSRNYSEIWVVDHSTTTGEAAGQAGGRYGHGGDLLYRWGNPQVYGAGTAADQQLFGQHHAEWIKDGLPGAGDILINNNGLNRPQGAYSSAVEITTPRDAAGMYVSVPWPAWGPTQPDWTYTAPGLYDFYSDIMGGEQRLPDGNTMVTVGTTGQIFEITPDGRTIWNYDTSLAALEDSSNTNNAVFFATWYPGSYAGLLGKNLTPENPVLGPLSRSVATAVSDTLSSSSSITQLLAGSKV